MANLPFSRVVCVVATALTLPAFATACGTDETAQHDALPRATTMATTHMTAPDTGPLPAAPPAGSGHGLCLDANSAMVHNAVASLGNDPNGGQWQVETASDNPLGRGCDLDFVLVTGSGYNDATATSRVLLFHGGEFVGTVEPVPYSYTAIAGFGRDSVAVRYRWLLGDDAFCCPDRWTDDRDRHL
ncbi:LppP/LprE family lipoprotein [Gordonia hankookensis]|uniref:LppP/LprE family lipoprotein n=1 Tax=Gordonia hankookensis TaxID=589403 RepID=UPI001CBF17EA|nr:LppP/LprE family lipoprotein [Gordonia hankookensis]